MRSVSDEGFWWLFNGGVWSMKMEARVFVRVAIWLLSCDEDDEEG